MLVLARRPAHLRAYRCVRRNCRCGHGSPGRNLSGKAAANKGMPCPAYAESMCGEACRDGISSATRLLIPFHCVLAKHLTGSTRTYLRVFQVRLYCIIANDTSVSLSVSVLVRMPSRFAGLFSFLDMYDQPRDGRRSNDNVQNQDESIPLLSSAEAKLLHSPFRPAEPVNSRGRTEMLHRPPPWRRS